MNLLHRLTNTALFLALFVAPVVVVAAYELVMASDRYESTASMIMTEERPAASSSIDLSLLGLSNSAADKDALVVKAFAGSPDMLRHLDRRLGLRAHYSDPGIDIVSRLSAEASFEELHSFFSSYLTTTYDSEAKILTFAVQAYDPAFAKVILDAVIARAQDFINQLNDQVTGEQLRFFEDELARAEARLREAKKEQVTFQQANSIYSTEGEGQTIMSTIMALEKELAAKSSEIAAKLSFLTADSPQIESLRTQIAALKDQIRQEKQRLSGTQGRSLSEIDSEYRDIQLNLEFVSNNYKSTLGALEQVRMDAARKLKFLVVVTEPYRADESEYPRRAYIIATTAMVSLMLFAILSLVVAIIREHA